ncbi:hypothetical protein [Arthrobacter sp. 260]|uniref:hypothetical protein n=1 Tax=Arthrobacter sp. 260 TaxID=2735314 RepID=UPI001490F3E7|nr:hypothetical protein [Arthrobacter sp. 260]NOJ60205.1 hypothetical protein [Arthrobacter sp. 260]
MITSNEQRKWLEDFIVELRLRDVPGDLIGDAVSTVEAHLQDTGESPIDAFGPPDEYAENLALPGRRNGGAMLWVGRAVGVAAFTVLPFAITPVVTGRDFEVTAVLLTLILVVCAALVVISVNLDAIVRSWAIWQSGLLGMGIALAVAAAIGLTPDVVFLRLPAIPMLVGACLAVAGFIWWAARSADPVVRPTLRIS